MQHGTCLVNAVYSLRLCVMEHRKSDSLRFVLRPENFCIYRLPPNTTVNFTVLNEAGWYSITRTPEEISIVAPQEIDPGPGECEPGWSCLGISEQLDFSLVGIIAHIARLLADAGISIFTVSTYNTDYILVKSSDIDKTIRTLTDAGHEVTGHSNP